MQKYWISNSSKALPSLLLRFSIIHAYMKTNTIPKVNWGVLFRKRKLGNVFVGKHTGNLQ